MSWTRVTLGEVCEIISGATPKTGISEYWDGNIEWATPTDLSKLSVLTIKSTARRLTEAGLASCAARVLPAGSVLFSSRAPIGHVAINTVPMATNQGFKSMVPKPGVLDSRYLAFWLRAHKPYLQSLGTGATFKEVSKSVVSRVELALPPISEQRRIATILDHADALRAKRQRTLVLPMDLERSVFDAMFGNPLTATDTATLGEVATLTGGRNLVALDLTSDAPFRVLKISAVTTGIFKPEESKPLPLDYSPPESHLVRRGDLLISRANTAELVGAVAHVGQNSTGLVLPDKIWRFEWKDPDSVPEFYRALLSHPSVRRRISALSSGSGGSMKNISKAKLQSLLLPRVAPARQREYAQQVALITSQRQLLHKSLVEINNLFASLQSRAFS